MEQSKEAAAVVRRQGQWYTPRLKVIFKKKFGQRVGILGINSDT